METTNPTLDDLAKVLQKHNSNWKEAAQEVSRIEGQLSAAKARQAEISRNIKKTENMILRVANGQPAMEPTDLQPLRFAKFGD